MDRVVEQFTPSVQTMFEPDVSLAEFIRRTDSGKHLSFFKEALKKKVLPHGCPDLEGLVSHFSRV
jgi:hypothetical protein